MRKIADKDLFAYVEKFSLDKAVLVLKVIDFEPDCIIYVLKSRDDETKYALVQRDFVFDDTEAENRILSKELGIEVVKRFVIDGQSDYWLEDNSIDSFSYYFSLTEIK